jgi:LysR family transcriptional regulator of abg operon
MKLNQLRDMIAVADLGSLRAAARHLNISQSAISKSVQQLERELDVPLFERHKRGAVLTPMGALFVQRARAASGELTRAQEEISQHRGIGLGHITIGLSTMPQIALLPSVIGPFMQRYPEVRLAIVEALGFHSVEAQLRNGSVDVYVGVAPTARLSNEYQVESLLRNRRAVIARASHPLVKATSLRELTEARWVVSSTDYADTTLATLFRRHHCRVPTRLTFVASVLGQVTFLLNSDMLLNAPEQLLEFAPFKGHLVRIPVREEIDAPSVVMVRRAALPLTPAAEHFCDLIRRESVPLEASAAARARTIGSSGARQVR